MKARLASRYIAAASLALSFSVAHAQPVANSFITPQKPLSLGASVTSTSVTALLTCSTSVVLCQNGAMVEGLNVALNSTLSHLVSIYLCTASCPAATYLFGTFALPPLSASSSAITPYNLLGGAFMGGGLPVNNNGNKFIFVPAGGGLSIIDINANGAAPLIFGIIGAAY